jgi:hypothetical protein
MPKKIQARKSSIHGNGVFAVADIKQGERVIEYKGKRRTHAEVDADDTGDVESGHTFLFTLNEDYVIDANHKGNDARWINHSCDPNCEAMIEEAEGDDRTADKVFIEAVRDIKPGEELTYNYAAARPSAPARCCSPSADPRIDGVNEGAACAALSRCGVGREGIPAAGRTNAEGRFRGLPACMREGLTCPAGPAAPGCPGPG